MHLPISTARRSISQRIVAMLLVGVVVPLLAPRAHGAPASIEPAKFVFLLDYIGRDYALAVKDGKIISIPEYEEIQTFADVLIERFDEMRDHGAPGDILAGLEELRRRIHELDSPDAIRRQADALVTRLVDELDVVRLPAVAPNLERGRRLYANNCLLCHGTTGAGDGPSAEGLKPPVRSFRDPRTMATLSPRQIHATVTYGVTGTAMPAFAGELDDDEMWDIAFLVMTLREGFDPQQPAQHLPISLAELASRSNESLLDAARAADPDATMANIDYYRRHPAAARAGAELARAAHPTGSPAAAPSPAPPPSPGSALQLAIQLQDAFAEVAERAAPGVVGVAGFARRGEGGEGNDAGNGTGSWQLEDGEGRLYPGFAQVTSGSGFLIDDAGHVLTAGHVLEDPAGGTVPVVDIELDNGRHVVARIVGMEPTLNLAVLRLETFGAERILDRLAPLTVADPATARVGHWAIALGNPAGPGTTFEVGTLSSQPERQCYQEDLSATLIQSSVNVPPGSYGGPLVNIEGQVLGMTVPPPGIDVQDLAPGPIGYALPIDLAMTIFDALKKTESRVSPWLGFSVLELAAARQRLRNERVELPRTGLYIDDVYEPSPAASAGIRIGDSLISIDGHRLMSVRTFQKWLYLCGIGSNVVLEVFRDGKTFEKTATIEQRPAAAVPR